MAALRRSSCGLSLELYRYRYRTNRATHSLSHKVSVDADLVSFDAALVDAGRRAGLEYAVIPAVTGVQHLRVCVLTRVAGAVPSRGGVDHRPVERRWGTETACTGSSQRTASAPTLLDTVGRPEWRPVAPR